MTGNAGSTPPAVEPDESVGDGGAGAGRPVATKGDIMEWLVSEVFKLAKAIGDALAAAYNDGEVPVMGYAIVRIGDKTGSRNQRQCFCW